MGFIIKVCLKEILINIKQNILIWRGFDGNFKVYGTLRLRATSHLSR